jgi:predicted metalloprotease with PDZ domain
MLQNSQHGHPDPAASWVGAAFLRLFRFLHGLRFSVLSVFVLSLLSSAPAAATIHYSISLAERSTNHFHVRMDIPNVQGPLELDMPVWNGLYQIRDFAARISELHAQTPFGAAVPLVRLTPHSWRAGPVSGTLVLDYSILWDEPSPFSSELNSEHAFLNPATVLLYAPARRSEDVSLEFSDVPSGWRIATALDSSPTASTLIAPNYDALAQGPIEIGSFNDFTLQAADRPIRVVIHAAPLPGALPAVWSREHLEDAARRIVQSETALMGDAPFPRYVFLLHLGTGGGGGMEHPNSTAISVGPNEDPAPTMAHEFFHAWNVLRIRPQSLEPVDYTREQITDTLWFAEGVTSTIAAYTMVRTDLWSRETLYRHLASQVGQLVSRPARRFQSVQDSSIAAWLEKYPFYRAPASSISYYNKGMLLGFCLDILLREATNNRESLDTLLRAMNQRYAHEHEPYADTAAIQALASELAGQDLSDFFRRYVAGTEEAPFDDIFARGGFLLERVSSGSNRVGAAPSAASPKFRVVEANVSGLPRAIRESILTGRTAAFPH